MLLFIGIGIVVGVLACGRRSPDSYHSTYAMTPDGKPIAYGMPQPMPTAGMHPAYGYGGGYTGYGGGYSGTAVAGSAAAGFVGGMLVSEALDHHHHHGGGDYGGGYSSGGNYSDGGDYGGGGDSGFAADS